MKGLLIVFIIIVLNYSPSNSQDVVPSTTIHSIEGKKFDFNSLKNKVVVLNFWYTACLPCRKEIPSLRKLHEMYKNNSSVIFIAISSLDDAEQLEYFKRKVGFDFHLIPKENGWVEFFKIKSFPTNIIISKNKIIYSAQGYSPKLLSSMSTVLDSVLMR